MARRICNSEEVLGEVKSNKKLNIDNELVQEMLKSINLVDVLNDEYGLSLEHQHGNEYIGHCPYPSHRDSTPSFSVNSEKGVYHCWGCNENGNLLTFMMKIEGLSFQEAVLKLSSISGMDIGEYNGDASRAIHGINGVITDWQGTYCETELPTGMPVEKFLRLVAQRIRGYELKINNDPIEIDWIDKTYALIDKYEEQGDHKAMCKIWDNLSKEFNIRLKQYKERCPDDNQES
jgi:hypothetical protein